MAQSSRVTRVLLEINHNISAVINCEVKLMESNGKYAVGSLNLSERDGIMAAKFRVELYSLQEKKLITAVLHIFEFFNAISEVTCHFAHLSNNKNRWT